MDRSGRTGKWIPAAVGLVSGWCVSGMAAGDIVIEAGSFGLAPGQLVSFEASGVGAGPRVTGIRFKGFYTDQAPGGNWAADTRMSITGPEGSVIIGGADGFSFHEWSFDGSQSDKTGSYEDEQADVLDSRRDGLWRVVFRNDYADGDFIQWDNVAVTLVTRCPADVDGSGRVDFADLNTLLDHWDMAVAPGTGGDIDGDGLVTFSDLNALLAGWECE